jgi:glutaredoxin/glutathione-dependent peroxiredoxin
MTIRTGDRLPGATFTIMTPEGPASRSTEEIFGGRTVVLFAVPGAFTPTCDRKHLPTYLAEHDAIKAKGVDLIACLAVNDVFVLDAWARASAVGDRILMLADGNADFVRAIGLAMDSSRFGMGTRSRRFSMLVEDEVVTEMHVDEPGQFELTGARNLACQLSAAGTAPDEPALPPSA